MEIVEQIGSWISIREAEKISGYGKDWLRRLAKSGEVKSAKMGFAVLIDRESLQEYVEAQKKGN